MAKIITVCNRKGGVAKTTTCVTLGHGLALKGKKVLLVDVDPQGHIAPALGLEQGPGLFDLLVGGAGLRDIQRQARPNILTRRDCFRWSMFVKVMRWPT